ncbi:hypothetical protein GCM10009416_43550 [Craurococcus roseus]|uniref:DUF4398 domain-containing protein n=1 Tax=Craurococcus roseus TaxID=77585 RepID=A0ABN1FZ52_9PROT
MKRTHLLPAAGAALGMALLAAATPASAQRAGAPEADAAGPAEMLRRAQAALRGGQTAQASDFLERAETRLLTGVEPTKPGRGEPAFHASEARRALMNRDRAEAMRHTNMAIATARDGTATGDEAGGDRRGAQGGGPGAVNTGMGTLPAGTGRAVVWDRGTGGTSVSRAEGVVLAQSPGTTGTGTGAARGQRAPTGLPPGDTIPGWSGARGSGATPGASPQGSPAQPLGSPPTLAPPPGTGLQTLPPSGQSSSSIIGGEPARIGGAPPSDTSRAPGSSGIGGSGVGGTLR